MSEISIIQEEISCYITKTRHAYLLETENASTNQLRPKPLTESECENMAYFCRSFLSAWEFVQNQGE